ncbi:DUF2341 domain-containing protein [Candidatus Woesearchaeota archaeon]|nr:DUF2341 domain-containing protein [Candidatus Woesearchaeota archaeon]
MSSSVAADSINLTVVSPSSNANVEQGLFFNVTLNLSCDEGTCSNVSLTLDPAEDWYDDDWEYRKNITLNQSMINGTHTDFPILISATDADLASYAQSDGDDILFTDSDGTTKLAHEIELYNSTNGDLIAWVKIPTLNSTHNQTIYMYYNNSAASDQSNKTGVWTNQFLGVWHMKEDPAGSAPQIKDSSPYSINGTSAGSMTSGDQITGQIDGSLDFDGIDDKIDVTDSIYSIQTSDNITITAWIKINTHLSETYGNIWGDVDGPCFQLHSQGSGNYSLNWYTSSERTGTELSYGIGTWYHVAVTKASTTNLTWYRNAQGAGSTTTLSESNTAPNGVQIGGDQLGDEFINGTIDEVRISNTTRTQEWIATEYSNQAHPESFYTIGEEETASKGIVPTTPGSTPFWTNSTSNPLYFNLTGGESALATFYVNATGNIGMSFDFFAFAVINDNESTRVNSTHFNVTIYSASPPVRSNGAPSGNLSAGTTATNLSLTTDLNATCKYSNESGTSFASMTNTFSITNGTAHETQVNGLQNGTNYTFYVRCANIISNNSNTDDYNISFRVNEPDNTAPVISSVSSDPGTQGARITWDTDESANSTVEYGNTTSLGILSGSATLTTSHDITITGLSTNTTYYYNVTSCDSSENCNTTGTYNFTTGESAVNWTPPLGIPAPAFGIYDSVNDTEYTHWVDNSGACSDTSNNGTPSSPRCTIPSTLDAGSIVQVRGGPYNYGTSNIVWNASGTMGSPVYIRGPESPASRPVIIFGDTKTLTISTSSYLIIENLEMQSGQVLLSSTSDHLAIRHFYLHNNSYGPNPFLGIWCDYVVIYDSEIAYNGVIPSEPDDHAIQAYANTDHIWIVDNVIHHNSGDGIQYCHTCIAEDNGPAYVYMGRNLIYSNEENCIDIKEATGPNIMSENECYDYWATNTSNGDAIRIEDEGTQGDTWVINNYVHDAAMGINAQGAVGDSYILGNYITNVSYGIWTTGPSGSYQLVLLSNTFYNVSVGIGSGTTVANNIVSKALNYHIGGDVENCSNNLVYQEGGSATVGVSCSDNVVDQDPLLDSLTGKIISGSPAIDAGINSSIYDTFYSTFGISIKEDREGDSRPQNSTWDIGADEYEVGENDTSPPVISNIVNTKTNQTATITWTTSESANSSINYGTTENLGNKATNTSMTTEHSTTLSGLTNSTTYYYNITSCDTSGNCNTTGPLNFTTTSNPIVDTTPPAIALSYPANNTQLNNTDNTTLNFTVTDNGASALNCTLYLNETLNQTRNSISNNTPAYFNLTGLSLGAYSWMINCTDNSSNSNVSETWTFTIADTIAPGILIASPESTVYSTEQVLVNISTSGGAANTWFDWNSTNTTYTSAAYVNFTEGPNTLTAYANDSSGNVNMTNVTFTVNTTGLFFYMNWSEWYVNETTNFSSYNRTHLSNLSMVNFSNAYGKIEFAQNLNISENRNLTGHIRILQDSVLVNSTFLPEFNLSANVTFRNVSLNVPVPYKDGAACDALTCINQSHDVAGQTFSFFVIGFSTYEIEEGQCSDGIQNYGETGVDCGGPCSACPSPGGSSSGGGGGGGSVTIILLTGPEIFSGQSTTLRLGDTLKINSSSGLIYAALQSFDAKSSTFKVGSEYFTVELGVEKSIRNNVSIKMLEYSSRNVTVFVKELRADGEGEEADDEVTAKDSSHSSPVEEEGLESETDRFSAENDQSEELEPGVEEERRGSWVTEMLSSHPFIWVIGVVLLVVLTLILIVVFRRKKARFSAKKSLLVQKSKSGETSEELEKIHQLADYIKRHRDSGEEESVIKQRLLSVGWKESIIDEQMRKL